jgi:hypothetical protein
MPSVQPEWCLELPVQQQSVLFLAGRGPDGIAKDHPCKPVQIAYRACVFKAAYYGRLLRWGEQADKFMSLHLFADDLIWAGVVRDFFRHSDSLPHHYMGHLMHGAQILGYKHPDPRFRQRWFHFYLEMVHDLHLNVETVQEMDQRLSDWGRKFWDE